MTLYTPFWDDQSLLILLVIGIFTGRRVVAMFLQHRKIQMLLAERKLLIEKGVTDLPPLQLPEIVHRTDSFGNLKAGVVLLFTSGGLLLSYLLRGTQRPFFGDLNLHISITCLLAALGFALLVIHFLVRAYDRSWRLPPSSEEE